MYSRSEFTRSLIKYSSCMHTHSKSHVQNQAPHDYENVIVCLWKLDSLYIETKWRDSGVHL